MDTKISEESKKAATNTDVQEAVDEESSITSEIEVSVFPHSPPRMMRSGRIIKSLRNHQIIQFATHILILFAVAITSY